MTNIYLPIDNVSDFACYSVYDKDTIRAYYTQPHIDSSSEYVDLSILIIYKRLVLSLGVSGKVIYLLVYLVVLLLLIIIIEMIFPIFY